LKVARVRNVTGEKFVDYWDSIPYVIEVGEEVNLPEHVAKHFIGDWNLKDEALRERERRRVIARGSAGKLELIKVIEIDEKKKQNVPEPDVWKTIMPQEVEPEFEEFKKKKKGRVI